MTDYRALNRASWDDRVTAHVASADYAVARFLAEPDFISNVVRFDLPLLGDVRDWAGVVAALLRPGGRLFIRDEHPVLWALDQERDDQLLVLRYQYFETAGPVVEDSPGTYVATDAAFEHNVTNQWNHGIGEIVTALLDAGLALTGLVEHDSVPWDALYGKMTPIGGGKWRLTDSPARLPHSFTIQAVKPRG